MIQVGQKKKAKFCGEFTVGKVARLKRPMKCQCVEVGTSRLIITYPSE